MAYKKPRRVLRTPLCGFWLVLPSLFQSHGLRSGYRLVHTCIPHNRTPCGRGLRQRRLTDSRGSHPHAFGVSWAWLLIPQLRRLAHGLTRTFDTCKYLASCLPVVGVFLVLPSPSGIIIPYAYGEVNMAKCTKV